MYIINIYRCLAALNFERVEIFLDFMNKKVSRGSQLALKAKNKTFFGE